MPDDDEKGAKQWVVRDVPELTRRMVKSYAVNHQMTIGEALQLLVSRGIAVGITTTHDPAVGVLRDMTEKTLSDLVNRVAEEIERRKALSPEARRAEEAERQSALALARGAPSTDDVDVRQLFAGMQRTTDDEE